MRVGLLAAVLTISAQTICWTQTARAMQTIQFGAPTLAPMAFTRFCMKYVNECKPQRLMFRGGRIKLTNLRWTELANVNSSVNSAIRNNKEGIADQEWLLGPLVGNCNDYAVTKRHQLRGLGWPARAVLLGEVVTFSGEHHLVVVVRTNIGDLVLDNLTDVVMPWFQKPFQWVRVQTSRDPNYWASISEPSAAQNIIRKPVRQRFSASPRSGVI